MNNQSRFIAALLLPLLIGCADDKPANPEKKSARTEAPTAKAAPTETSMPAPGSAPSAAPTKSHQLDDIGYVIDAPPEWELKKLGEAIYTFRIKMIKPPTGPAIMPSVTITKSFMGAETQESVAKRCPGTLLKTGLTQNKAVFHNCEKETAGVKIFTAEYFHKVGDDFIICAANGLDLDTMNKACGSLRVE